MFFKPTTETYADLWPRWTAIKERVHTKQGEYWVLLDNTRVTPDAMSPREKVADDKASTLVAGPPTDPRPSL